MKVNDLGYNINIILNKIIYTKRDQDGNLLEINYNAQNESFLPESVIQLHIQKVYHETSKSAIKKNLLHILKHVKAAVHDWGATITLLDNARNAVVKAGHSPSEKQEALDLIDWAKDNNFIFLGFSETYFTKNQSHYDFSQKKQANLGIQKISNFDDFSSIPKKVFLHNVRPIVIVSKLIAKSPVHRPVNLDMIRITIFDDTLNPTGELRFIGLFTSKLFYQYAKDIPLIRKKIDYVTKKANFDPHGHNGKALVSILESYPREELFPIKKAELLDTCLGIIKLGGLNIVKTFFRVDSLSRFISVICFIPKKNFSIGIRRNLQKILASEISPNITSHATLISDQPLARVHFIIVVKDKNISKINYDKIENLISNAAINWRDQIEKEIFKTFDENIAITHFNNFGDCFPASYQEHFKITDAINDIAKIDKVLNSRTPSITLSRIEKEENLFNLKLYTLGSQVTLSNIMPTLNNFGLNVISENLYLIKPLNADENTWLNHFTISIDLSNVEYNNIKKHFESAVLDCWLNKYENDHLNQLLLKASFNIKDIALIRSFVKYIIQTNFSFSIDFIENTLVKYPHIVKNIRDLFYEKFSPEIKERNIDKIKTQIGKDLQEISNISHDLIFKKLLEIIDNMLRTNYFQSHKNHYISFKLSSKNLTDILLPKPYAEIFVYSSDTEGIHLRGGKVARGGLRWSDRVADYRTEVHGLAKAQMTKNAIIVPVGSKGGFIVKKDTSNLSREEFTQAGIDSYTTFLSGLLDITDNIIDDKIIKPNNVVCYDDDDPYLVVAADKGTATFSDIANKISEQYNFWLGDAFASGGSQGYDHKKMGITAKGAWESVARHFFEDGINIKTDPFTTVGIGDMSGDVFGNGMLLSKNIKLVAAFNHMHIFIDPEPNIVSSYKERARLFNLPRSGWSDYNEKLLSKGGAIYSRSQKSIKLSKEIMKLLGLKINVIAPNQLIQAILKAEVDLLWNGGIGTYIKASTENNADVGDKNNDALRVDAKELKCRIIGEGGNLGLTQRGRIEYAQNNGRINTDSIDNSGGVNCSDNEVNIKITLQDLVQKKSISLKNRDKLLEEMTDDIEKSVLHDSFLSAQAVSLAESNNYNALEHQERLMKRLEDCDLLDRKVEFLPDTEEINRLKSEKAGLTRPELCVLLSYSKIYLYNDLVNSSLPDEGYYLNELIKYFPEKLVKKFRSAIFNHPLKSEIICTFVANSMVNRLGITFFNRISEDTGIKICDIARAYTIIKDSFELPQLWRDIEKLEYNISAEIQIEMFREISKFIEHSTLWLLRTYRHTLDVIETYVEIYHDKLDIVLNNLEKVLSNEALTSFKENYHNLRNNNVPEHIARKVAALDFIPSVYQIIYVSQKSDLDLLSIARIYFNLGVKMHFRYLNIKTADLNPDTYWEKLSIKSYTNNLFDQQMRITSEVVQTIKKKITIAESEASVTTWLDDNKKQICRYYELIADIQTHEFPDFSMLNVAGHRVKEISSTIKSAK